MPKPEVIEMVDISDGVGPPDMVEHFACGCEVVCTCGLDKFVRNRLLNDPHFVRSWKYVWGRFKGATKDYELSVGGDGSTLSPDNDTLGAMEGLYYIIRNLDW